MNRHALTVLEFSDALDVVAGHAANPVGAAAVRALEPSRAVARIEDELRGVDEMMTFVLRGEDWAVPTIPDLRDALKRLAVDGSLWEGGELRDGAVLLESARATRRAILRSSDDHPRLSAIARRLARLEDEAARIRRAIDEHGDVRDGASRELARLRREIRDVRGGIVERLERFVAELPARVRVPDASVTIRDGRYVVPIRREGRSRVGGIVHDESATGGTLFVEPPVAIEWMNRLRDLESREAREVRRILGELTGMLRPHRAELTGTFDALVAIDSLSARARYALRYDGRRPDVLPPGSDAWRIVRGRHPLLLAADPGGVVPFDLRMEPGERTLLVSGPNTGGKTVLLKAIGLIAALAQAGIVPPVGPETKLPLFRDIFADIGDEQSIEASLSTFSAHLKNLREILDEADGESLALIDEIGSGTDPAEGGALAQAILLELTRRGTLTVATSHLGRLKLLAGGESGVVNASLQFDSGELRPTYRLVKGVPGRSYGLAIARRLGFPESVVERAEAFQPGEEREVGELLREIEAKERRLAEKLDEATAARSRAAAFERELAGREEELARREKDEERRARQQARDLLMHARAQVEAAIRDLREVVGRDAADALDEHARRARRRVEEAAGRQAAQMPERHRERPRARRGPPGSIEPGATVRVAATGATGTVVELRDGRATIEAGGLRLQVPVEDLDVEATADEARAAEQGKRKRSAPTASASSAGGWTGPAADASPEVHLRGLRADEVESTLTPALDAAVQAGLPTLRIIHGKGTGALREVVRELLERDRRVRSFRLGGPGEGGSGVTIAELE